MNDKSIVVEGYVNTVARDSKTIHSPNGDFVEQVLPRTWSKALRKACLLYTSPSPRDS